MAFGFGCVGSVLLFPLSLAVVALCEAIWPSSWIVPASGVAAVLAVHLSIGIAIGIRAKRWGYLWGTAWSFIVLLAGIGGLRLLLKLFG